MSIKLQPTKRGDTLIEVMFAVGFFALIAIIAIAVMNLGVSNAERDLELVTARNELNAQAEALRFIHSSYISEKTLPTIGEITSPDEKHQQYDKLWEAIVSNAVSPTDAQSSGMLNFSESPSCDRFYDTSGGLSPLQKVKAFVLNTRRLAVGNGDVSATYISINRSPALSRIDFKPTDLSARIIYGNGAGASDDGQFTDVSNNAAYRYFDQVRQVEGIWVFAVTDGNASPTYYDFYIQSCWFGPRALRPTMLDTVIRLYNPENV